MFVVKDPAIKLFGKTIPLHETQIPVDSAHKSVPGPERQENKDVCRAATKTEVDESPENDNQTLLQKDKEMVDIKSEEDQINSDSSGQEKLLKKPDKILPCPRCNSVDTKFCYYNNYNVNQPRHFCKNCQRYWTAGGTMRNVPVGAGRRKNKHIASQYRHIMMSSDGIPIAHNGSPDSANHQVLSCGVSSVPARSLNGNEAVLKFSPEAPLCESMTSVLNIGDTKKQAEIATMLSGEICQNVSSCGSSVTTSNCREDEFPENMAKREHVTSGARHVPTPHPLQSYPGPPWVYPWNSGWNGVDAMTVCRPDSSNTKPVQWGSTTMVGPPAFCTQSIPFPLVPAATYWGGWATGAWNVPWVGSTTGVASPSSSSGCSSNGSPTLGKHSRDANIQGDDKPEKCIWVPKTLRIDEAAKSSIWDTLGIKPNQKEPIAKGGIFKVFLPKTKGNAHESDSTNVLHANPAALSRSQTFQEST